MTASLNADGTRGAQANVRSEPQITNFGKWPWTFAKAPQQRGEKSGQERSSPKQVTRRNGGWLQPLEIEGTRPVSWEKNRPDLAHVRRGVQPEPIQCVYIKASRPNDVITSL